jgi:hypothetical protein
MALISRRTATVDKGTKVESVSQNGLAAYELTRDEFMKVAVFSLTVKTFIKG